ncbi:hypothetical protein CR158_07760 [Halomonas heilongjiangensis]|uniref:Uncharacterized protein n=1 Tax=Halomonas heilongjiangensis TaxID=1387883 RepID=A0A2N7TVH0_9GAMM|nr:hypothetical protein C1H66_00395 [Halomonas heilongjiangensis]PXX91399.1 hypothetical protein CR158_07760 [Halomonas heilongjiangensis]
MTLDYSLGEGDVALWMGAGVTTAPLLTAAHGTDGSIGLAAMQIACMPGPILRSWSACRS